MRGQATKRVAILGGLRTPFCRSYTKYNNVSNQEMMTAVLTEIVEKYKLKNQKLDDVSLGAVIKHSKDFNLARESLLSSGLSPKTPAFDIQRACGTSITAAIVIASKISSGMIKSGIAGGVDSISDLPIVYPDAFRNILLSSFSGRKLIDRILPWLKLRPRHLKPSLPSVDEPRTHLSMGESMEITAKKWGLRREDQDLLAMKSHLNASQAYDEGFYEDLVINFNGIKKDNNIRPDTNIDKLSKLKPVFDRSSKATLTAGNSTPLTDGASAILLSSEEWAKERDLPIQTYLNHAKVSAVDFINDEGLLMAPVYAISEMLTEANLELQDFDFYEIHEAFSAQTLATLKALESESFCKEKLNREKALGSIDLSKLNIKGGSVALGHPFAATGTRIIASLSKMLIQKKKARGLVSVCTAGGMGVTAILESSN